ncbi:MAG: hypothetical protein E4G91_09360 [Candidatus Zixiibacteriota bacterium]|nr:MAG: hypothetical protein E4G91_09360 [candidate division Zixibacteria bacterium]
MTTQRFICLVSFLFATALLLAGCSTKPANTFDPRSGVVSKDFQVDIGALIPDTIRQDSKYDNYYTCDHIVFLGQHDSLRYVLSVTFGRALADNRFKRAERDFTGFLYDGRAWIPLPYTRMKHDSMRVDINYPYVFGGLNWTQPHTDGEVSYDRHDLKFDLKFSELAPVQSLRIGVVDRRCHAIGNGTLLLPNDTITGTAYYELVQIEGNNPFVHITNGLIYTNYDWLALTSTSGRRLLCSSDSTTANDRIKKNFLSLESSGSLRYADGSDHVRVISEDLVGDLKTNDLLASKKNISVPDLGIEVKMTLTDERIFNTNGNSLSLVAGTLTIDGKLEDVWGVIEHRR